jgi:hypothetical protein
MDRLESELARLRSNPGDLSVADHDVLIEDVERSRAEAIRRLELLSHRLLGPSSDPVTRAVIEGEIGGLEGVLANLKAQREERATFARRAMRYLARAVEDPARGAGVQDLAENIAESLAKGDRVFVHGTVTTEAWADKQTGEKRTAQRVLADIVGPSLRWATARITKTSRIQVGDQAPDDVPNQEA